MFNLKLLSSLLLLSLFNSPPVECVKFKAIRILNQETLSHPARETRNQVEEKPAVAPKRNTFFGGSQFRVTGSKPVVKSRSLPVARAHQYAPVQSQEVAAKLVQSQFRRKVGQTGGQARDLNSVAKTMRAAVVNRKTVQPALRQQSGPVHRQQPGQLQQPTQRQQLPARGQQQSSGGLQGFKVAGDDSNKIIFLDVEALRAAGLSLDESAISLGSDTTGSSLQRIDGLKTSNSISQPKLQQARRIDQERSQASSQPRVSIKHVDANELGHSHATNQRLQALNVETNIASSGDVQSEVSRHKPKLFFSQHQGSGRYNNNKFVAQRSQASSKASSASFESFSHFPAVGKVHGNSNARSGKSFEVDTQVADTPRPYDAEDDSLQFLASLKNSRNSQPTVSRTRSQPIQQTSLSRSAGQSSKPHLVNVARDLKASVVPKSVQRAQQPSAYQRSEQSVLAVSQLLRSTTHQPIVNYQAFTTQPPTYQSYTTRQPLNQDYTKQPYQSYTSESLPARQTQEDLPTYSDHLGDHARQIQALREAEKKVNALQGPQIVLADKYQQPANIWENHQRAEEAVRALQRPETVLTNQYQQSLNPYIQQNTVQDSLGQRTLEIQQQQQAGEEHARGVAEVLRQEEALKSLTQPQQQQVPRFQQQTYKSIHEQHQDAVLRHQLTAAQLAHQHKDAVNIQHQIDARDALNQQHLTPHQRGLAQHQAALENLRRNQQQLLG